MADTKYFEGIGRRKTANARVRITPASKTSLVVNEKDGKDYFGVAELVDVALSPFKNDDVVDDYAVTVKVSGGGHSAQAEAIRHGIARALVKKDEKLRSPLKLEGLLTRDARVKERKKPGLKKARKSAQWSKR